MYKITFYNIIYSLINIRKAIIAKLLIRSELIAILYIFTEMNDYPKIFAFTRLGNLSWRGDESLSI